MALFGSGIAGLVALFTATSAMALTQQQLDWCANQGNSFTPDQQISGCTAAAESDRWTGKVLAWTYFNRAIAWNAKGELRR